MLRTYGKLGVGCWLVAILLAVMPLTASAARLGKLSVYSTLDQALRAEIDVSATEEETATLSARLVRLDNLGSERSESALIAAGVRFALDKRANGQPYLRVNSDKPLKEQFIDMFVEVRWAGGKRVHEYSFLLEAPEASQRSNAVPVAPAVKKDAALPVAPPKAVELVTVTPKRAAEPAPEPVAPKASVEVPSRVVEPPVAAPVVASGETRRVAKGDTLGKIAQETRVENVHLLQMMAALFRGNEHAFDGGNMNRLRVGEFLGIPKREAVVAIELPAARSLFIAQSIEFDAFRKMLAESAGKGGARDIEAPGQAAGGRVSVQTDDRATKDKLEVSRAESGRDGAADGGGSGGAITVEDQIAMGKSLQEANSRIAELERNLSDLKKLASLSESVAGKGPEAPPGAVAGPASAPPPSLAVGNVELALAALGVVLTLGYLAYRSSSRKREQAKRAIRMGA